MGKFLSLRPLRSLIAALFVAAALQSPLIAGQPYIDVEQISGVELLPPPPTPDSAEGIADLASARAVFKNRTPAEQKRAEKDASLSIYNFQPAIGDFFRKGEFPKVDILLESVKTNISEIINTPKKHWKRQRPYQLDPELALGKPEESFAYPSGHSTRGTVQSLIMAELFPEKREAILEFGRTIGWDRVIIGKHFPTDVNAGRVLGKAIVRELKKSPAFQRDLAAAKAEVEAAAAPAGGR